MGTDEHGGMRFRRRRHPEPSVTRAGRVVNAGDDARALSWEVAVETPVALRYNGEDHVVMLATPADLDDFARGFSLSECLVAAAGDIEAVNAEHHPAGIVLNVRVAPERLHLRPRGRAFEGRSGCGLCGTARLEDVIRPTPPVTRRFRLESRAVLAAFRDLPGEQPLNARSRSVHGAAWCAPDGRILLVREDIGRHNALDKLIGAIAQAGLDFADGFAVLSSRCSFELVQKAATVGIPALASLSAPTALALELADAAGIEIATRAPDGVVYLCHPRQPCVPSHDPQ